ncbi:MAG: ATP-grasp domain-containing protein [Methanoregula sp.]|nr:ATP-grasp domain-containing protein [Methanoregula sp.]
MKNILISPAGGQAISGIIEYFKKNGYAVTGIDSNPNAIGKFFCDRFCTVPRVQDSGYREAVLDIVSGENIDLFISWLDPEIQFWNELFFRDKIPESVKGCFALNFRRDLQFLYDKYSLCKLLEKNAVRTPETKLLSSLNPDRDGKTSLPFPVVVKPRIGFGSREMYIAKTHEDLSCHFRKLIQCNVSPENFLIQEFIPGTEYTIDFFATGGQIDNLVVRNRLEQRGVSLRGEIIFDDTIETIVRKTCKVLELDGLNNLQLIKKENTCFVTDINLRPSGTIIFSIEAGIDMLRNVMERSQGMEITRFGKPRSLRMIRYLREHYYE